ncbi:hypothetical protein NC797_08255 [Aquibacillus sp. 3ASR75-11]|uniref:Uncharacterized protein n=1 Tax=Terrihalobacillus insolitus TaxID=2950438 RepID=A0A9X3WUY7_9BACI|nr:hypothetical protein [Terrihalobacillus insolitus]MDC3424501.1 hypothetical protein [Terrihalobacillus insolitus]
MIKKVIIALLSTVIFSVLLGGINYITMSDKTIEGLWGPMFFFGLYSLPGFFFLGIPLSVLIEKITYQKSFKSNVSLYFTKFVLYFVTGAIAAFVFMMILAIAESEIYLIGQELVSYMMYGVIASLIYYHISLIIGGNKK